MFESLFGAGTPLAVRFFIAFLVVFVLIGVTAWLVRRFGTGRLGTQTTRGRQPRLAVIDAAPVDGRRRLVLIRRDNIEHLLMIGGPSDVVVETNIVRATAAARETTRDTTPARAATTAAAAASEPALPRAVPLGEAALWPLQPEPLPRTQRRAIAEETVHWPLPAEPGPRNRGSDTHPADTLAGLAAELAKPAGKFATGNGNGHAAHEPLSGEPEHAPDEIEETPEPVEAPPAVNMADQNLAQMAQRLEAALRRPAAPAPEASWPAAPKPATTDASPTSRIESVVAAARQANAATREGNGSARTQPKPEPKLKAEPKAEPMPKAVTTKSPFPSLEQEMASLLGRPPGKPG